MTVNAGGTGSCVAGVDSGTPIRRAPAVRVSDGCRKAQEARGAAIVARSAGTLRLAIAAIPRPASWRVRRVPSWIVPAGRVA